MGFPHGCPQACTVTFLLKKNTYNNYLLISLAFFLFSKLPLCSYIFSDRHSENALGKLELSFFSIIAHMDKILLLFDTKGTLLQRKHRSISKNCGTCANEDGALRNIPLVEYLRFQSGFSPTDSPHGTLTRANIPKSAKRGFFHPRILADLM